MKKFTLIFSLLLVSLSTMSLAKDGNDEAGIQFFHGSFKDALAKAKKEKKMIFMDAYTTWCGPCKYLKKNVFPDKALGQYMNEKFVSVAVDWESAEGQTLAAAYPLGAYPTMFFLDANGTTKGTLVGFDQHNPAGTILKEAKKHGK